MSVVRITRTRITALRMRGINPEIANTWGAMDVFKVHEQVIADYRAFTSGFVEVRDPRIKAYVEQQFAEGVQWPDPWVGLNPSFASGGSVPELVARGPAAPRVRADLPPQADLQDPGRDPIVLHRHQREAVEVARSGRKLRADDRHRLGQVAGLHRADRRRGAARERRQRWQTRRPA